MNIPHAKAVVVKEWENLQKLSAWQMSNVKSKRSHPRGTERGKDISFCYADGSHLKNSELDQKFQKIRMDV